MLAVHEMHECVERDNAENCHEEANEIGGDEQEVVEVEEQTGKLERAEHHDRVGNAERLWRVAEPSAQRPIQPPVLTRQAVLEPPHCPACACLVIIVRFDG